MENNLCITRHFLKQYKYIISGLLAIFIISLSSCGQASTPTPPPNSTATAEPSAPTATNAPTPTDTAAIATSTLQAESPAVNPVSPAATPTPESAAQSAEIPYLATYKIINTYPHDRKAFIQGLVFEDGIFYEGTGLYGQSTLRKVDPETGEVLQIHNLSPTVWGEGITIFGNKIYQLTWKSKTGYVYDKDTFELERQFTYPTQGWGITHDGQKLIMSDGSANLYFWDPETLEEIGRVEVRDVNTPVDKLNELEYINGEVYANIWTTDRIARINPETGEIVGWIILPGLLTQEDLTEQVDVLNGIAYDAENDRLFVTGKWWPKLFEIELVPINN